MTAPASATDSRIRFGTADLVSRRDAVRMVSLPNASIAAPTADSASYRADVVTRSWAMSDWSWASVAPYSALPNPPNSTVPSSTVISLLRRSPCEIWWSFRICNDSHTRETGVVFAHSSSGIPRTGLCAYNVHPRSRSATAIVDVLATPTSPMAMAISARCSTARRIEATSGAVSLPRSRSFRQSWSSAPPLR